MKGTFSRACKALFLNYFSSSGPEIGWAIRYFWCWIVLFFPQPQGDFNNFSYSLMHEPSSWISPTYAHAQGIHVNVEPSIIVVVQSFVGSTKFRPTENFEGPKLASRGFHVLKTAEPLVEVLAQEYTWAVASSLQVELAYTGPRDPYSIRVDNVHPFWEGENHLIAFAACAAGDAVPGFYVSPRYLSHLVIISWILSFKFLANFFMCFVPSTMLRKVYWIVIFNTVFFHDILERENVNLDRTRFWSFKIDSAFIKVIINAKKYIQATMWGKRQWNALWYAKLI